MDDRFKRAISLLISNYKIHCTRMLSRKTIIKDDSNLFLYKTMYVSVTCFVTKPFNQCTNTTIPKSHAVQSEGVSSQTDKTTKHWFG